MTNASILRMLIIVVEKRIWRQWGAIRAQDTLLSPSVYSKYGGPSACDGHFILQLRHFDIVIQIWARFLLKNIVKGTFLLLKKLAASA